MTTRTQRTENCYRQCMRLSLVELLKIINPADQITFGAMRYEDLVTYTRDWLQTEADELAAKTNEPEGLKLE